MTHHHHAAATSRTIMRALEEMEGKPREELAAFYRLKRVFSKYSTHTSGSIACSDLLTSLAKAILAEGEEEEAEKTSQKLEMHNFFSAASIDSAVFTCPTRRFGRTELQMPIISLGGMRLQQTWKPPDGFSQADVYPECQANFEAILERALKLGINHIETAKGYGSSELQYGEALRKLTTPRESYILQTKVRPMPDTDEFRRTLDRSLSLLGTHLDLFGFHGINRPEHLDWVLQPGGCLEVVQEYQQEGRVRFVGFSTHAPTPLIVKAINTGIFDYVNLHYHAIGSYTSSGTSESPSAGPGNWEAIEAAHRHDMGVFIISAADKGGMLYRPPKVLVGLCSPLPPLIYNMLWLWRLPIGPSGAPAVHTLVIGAARPSDFDEAVRATKLLDEIERGGSEAALMEAAEKRMSQASREVWGEDWADDWWLGLPDCYQNLCGVHVAQIVWMWAITKAYGLHRYSCTQYSKLEDQVPAWKEKGHLSVQERMATVFDWTPGLPYDPSEQEELAPFLPAPRRERLLCILREASSWFGKETSRNRGVGLQEQEGWTDAYNLQPDIPFPERVT